MLLEFGDVSREDRREECPSDMDDQERAPEDEAMYPPLPGGAHKDARRTMLKEYLRENYVVEGCGDYVEEMLFWIVVNLSLLYLNDSDILQQTQ